MEETRYLKLELRQIRNPGRWAKTTGVNTVLWGINDAIEAAQPIEFGPGDKTSGRRIARLAWLNGVLDHTVTSSKDLYPVEAIRIRNWLEGRNLATGEDEENSEELRYLRHSEITAWMLENWDDITTQVENRPKRRKRKKANADQG